MKENSNQNITKISQQNIQKLLAINKDERWTFNGEVKTDKICKMYVMDIQNRVASKGVVEDVEGTAEQILECLSGTEYIFKLDPQMKEFKTLEDISENVFVNYCRFKGIGPVSDRDFVLVDRYELSEDGTVLIDASSSIEHPHPLPNGVVRGWINIAGYIIEQTTETKCRVTYIADVDVRGMIPDFVKKITAKNQGEVASRVNACVIDWKSKHKGTSDSLH